MLSEQLRNKYNDIVSKSIEMVSSNIDSEDLGKGIDYVSIYAQSNEEFKRIEEELKNNGIVAIESKEGNYYKLKEPLKISNVEIYHCRIRVFDDEHPEVGYVDFEVRDYNQFKEKYLSRPHFSLLSSGEEMLELKDPDFSVRAYFPSGNF